MFDRLRDLLATPTVRRLTAEINRLTTRLEAAETTHANAMAERAPSLTTIDQLNDAKQLATDRQRRAEWLGLENQRLRNRVASLENTPTDLPADTRQLQRRLWLSEQARASLETRLATLQAANEAMSRELYDRAVAAEQTATVPAADAAAAA